MKKSDYLIEKVRQLQNSQRYTHKLIENYIFQATGLIIMTLTKDRVIGAIGIILFVTFFIFNFDLKRKFKRGEGIE